MNRYLPALAVLAIAVFFLIPAAQADEFSLDEESYKALNADAAKLYDQGAKQVDRVDYAEAFKSFQQAAERDPSHVGVRFLLAKFAVAEARKKSGKEAEDLLAAAKNAYEQIVELKGKGARLADVQRAERSLALVQQAQDSVPARDARLERIGNAIVLERAKEMYVGDVKRAQKEAEKRVQEAAMRGPAAQRRGPASGEEEE